MEKPNDIDVSVVMLTYYHENNVEQAIESVLSQKTDYRYEIVISDDCSCDLTPEILKRYSAKYPDIVRINLNQENVGIPKNLFRARCMARGKYLVALAGDDYWIYDRKIQAQADYLETHDNCIAVSTRVECRLDSDGSVVSVLPPEDVTGRMYTLQDFEQGKNINCHGLMFRNIFLTEDGVEYMRTAQMISNKVDDAVDNYLLLRKGDIYVMDLITDAYRIQDSDIAPHSYNNMYSQQEKCIHDIELYNRLTEIFGKETDFSKRFALAHRRILSGMLKDGPAKWKRALDLLPKESKTPLQTFLVFVSMLNDRFRTRS